MPLTLTQRSEPSYRNGFARSAAESASPNLYKGLVGAWVPAMGPTGMTLRDIVGENHGTLTNMDPATDWVVGEKGYAIDLDGTPQRVQLANTITLADDWSASVWVARESLFDEALLMSSSSFQYLIFYDGTGDTEIYTRSTSPTHASKTFDLGTTGVWHNIVLTRAGATVEWFVDGDSLGTDSSFSGNTWEFDRIGSNAQVGDERALDGKVGPSMIWDRCLVPNEIQHLYTDPLAPFRRKQYIAYSSQAAAAATIVPTRMLLGVGI